MLRSKIGRLRRRLGRLLGGDPPPTWVPPGHYYSPLANPKDLHVRAVVDNFERSELQPGPDLALDDATILQWLDKIAAFYPEFSFPENQAEGSRYYSKNDLFGVGDAAVYFGMIRSLKPKRIIEAGSGFSSCVAMDTNDRFFAGAIDLTFIEPYPHQLLTLLRPDDIYLSKLRRQKLQDVPIGVFETLAANDIFFIDSSHVGKMASDVNDYLFRILPRLAPGVFIHIHDILYPFEYPSWGIDHENRSWNEAYLLRAFLQYNAAFRVVYFNHYVYRRFPSLLPHKLPAVLVNSGGGLA